MSSRKRAVKKKTGDKQKKKSSVPRKPDGKIDRAKYNKELKERGNITVFQDLPEHKNKKMHQGNLLSLNKPKTALYASPANGDVAEWLKAAVC